MKRIRLSNTVFEGENNVYVLDDGEETALVDTGVSQPSVREDLESGLADAGRSLADVDRIFLTHWHYDHAGLAGEIQAESNATVHVHEADAPLVAGEESAVREERSELDARLTEWGMPDGPRGELEAYMDASSPLAGEPTDVTPFTDGDRFDVAGRELEVVHLPGHTAGLSALVFDGERGPEAFVGDAVLPKYTPNVGGADVRVDSPLARYVESLLRVVDAGWSRAWPGHRDPIDDPAGRAREILDHHRERTRRVVDVLAREGPCDPWTVSAHLFGSLEEIHILHGPGEAYAHLDHLASHGAVEREAGRYRLVDPAGEVDVDALFPPESRVGNAGR